MLPGGRWACLGASAGVLRLRERSAPQPPWGQLSPRRSCPVLRAGAPPQVRQRLRQRQEPLLLLLLQHAVRGGAGRARSGTVLPVTRVGGWGPLGKRRRPGSRGAQRCRRQPAGASRPPRARQKHPLPLYWVVTTHPLLPPQFVKVGIADPAIAWVDLGASHRAAKTSIGFAGHPVRRARLALALAAPAGVAAWRSARVAYGGGTPPTRASPQLRRPPPTLRPPCPPAASTSGARAGRRARSTRRPWPPSSDGTA